MQEKLVMWKEEGKEFSDKRVAWDWVKYNVRLFSIQESKSRAKVRREEENTLQKSLQEAQINFQRQPTMKQKRSLTFAKHKWKRSMIKELRELLSARKQDGTNVGKKVTSIF